MTSTGAVRDEHAWHACATPPPPTQPPGNWRCPICDTHWIWRRPPRPIAQWIRRASEEET